MPNRCSTVLSKRPTRSAIHRGLTSSMLSAPLRTRGTFERAAQPALLRVPDTLSDALMERLDRVAPSRRLATDCGCDWAASFPMISL